MNKLKHIYGISQQNTFENDIKKKVTNFFFGMSPLLIEDIGKYLTEIIMQDVRDEVDSPSNVA